MLKEFGPNARCGLYSRLSLASRSNGGLLGGERMYAGRLPTFPKYFQVPENFQ